MFKDEYDNIEKYYWQLMLLKLQFSVFHINIYKITNNVLGPNTNFLLQVD